MKRRKRDGKARALIKEQQRDYAETSQLESRLAELEKEIGAAASTPPQFQTWLREFLEALIIGNRRDYSDDPFFRDLRRHGLVDAVLHNIDQDDADSKERRRGAINWLPDDSIAWPVIRFALDQEDNHWWQTIARKWVTEYAPDRETAVAVLTEAVRQGCPLAALQLSRLAPDTPGLVDILAGVLSDEWIASRAQSYDYGLGGAGEAAQALARMGARARQALPRLRDAVVSERSDWHSDTDRWEAFEAYITICFEVYFAICEEEAESRALLDEWAARGSLEDEFLIPVVQLAREKPDFAVSLFGLVRSQFWLRHRDYSNKRGWLDAIQLLSERGRDSEIVLPILAAVLEHSEEEYMESGYHALATQATAVFLGRLKANRDLLSEEDRFITVLQGTAATDPSWLVYADWLEDRGDPRGEFLRLRHELASANGQTDAGRFDELHARQEAWLASRGHGWGELYDLVGQPSNAGSA
jgi:uncharacterized protein (TIGR02996 family)